MLINSVNCNFINPNNSIQKQSNQSLYLNKSDIVAFSGKVDDKKVTVPFHLQSKFQDEFHSTSAQVRMRAYLDYKEQGLTDEEITAKMFPQSYVSDNPEERQMVVEYVGKLHKTIDDIDASFKKVIPSLLPKTYYRGIVDNSSNRALQVIKDAKVGDVIKPDLGYPFMASKLDYAEGYSQYTDGSSNPETCAVMIIKTPAGTPISRDISFNLFTTDRNAVLARGANFEVLDKEVKNNKTYITLKYLNCALDEEK